MLECGFQYRLGLELSGMWPFLKLGGRGWGCLLVLRFPALLRRVMASANKKKKKKRTKINAIFPLSNLVAER